MPAGGGATLRGSDGQLHPRAPPKPLRVSAVFANAVPPPPTDQDEDPSSFYDELVIQVKTKNKKKIFVEMKTTLQATSKPSVESLILLLLCLGATEQAERPCGPAARRGKVAESCAPHRDFLWLLRG